MASSGGWADPSIVIVGTVVVDPVNEDDQSGALISTKGGDWVRSLGWMTPQGDTPEVATFLGPRTVVALGGSNGGGFPAGWRTDLAPWPRGSRTMSMLTSAH